MGSAKKQNTIKILPNDTVAEWALLSAMITFRECHNSVLSFFGIQNPLKDSKETLFYDKKNQIIYDAIVELITKSKNPDYITLSSSLKEKNLLDIVGEEYLADLAREPVAIAENVLDYADIIKSKYNLRLIITVGSLMMSEGYSHTDTPDNIIDRYEDCLFKIKGVNTANEAKTLKSVMHEIFYNVINKNKNSGIITTGYNCLDEATGGLSPGQLVIIAGRPGMGKSAFAMSMAYNIAKKTDKIVLFFSLEMSSQELGLRLIAMETGITSDKIKKGVVSRSDSTKLLQAAENLSNLKIHLIDSSRLRPFDIKTHIKSVKYNSMKETNPATSSGGQSENPIAAIFVDYLQLMDTTEKFIQREQQIAHISRSLKQIAKEVGVPVISLSQLSRNPEKREDGKPKLADLRESGSIEQDADSVMFVYRYHAYNKEEDQSKASILIEKQRAGIAPLEIPFRWISERTYFAEASNVAEYENSGYHSTGKTGTQEPPKRLDNYDDFMDDNL